MRKMGTLRTIALTALLATSTYAQGGDYQRALQYCNENIQNAGAFAMIFGNGLMRSAQGKADIVARCRGVYANDTIDPLFVRYSRGEITWKYLISKAKRIK